MFHCPRRARAHDGPVSHCELRTAFGGESRKKAEAPSSEASVTNRTIVKSSALGSGAGKDAGAPGRTVVKSFALGSGAGRDAGGPSAEIHKSGCFASHTMGGLFAIVTTPLETEVW